MPDQVVLFPLEFFVEGTPISLGASAGSKTRWRTIVSEAARPRRQETDEVGFLDERALALTIYYFANAPMGGDIDNIIKPIMDALIGVAYLDDSVVERVVSQKFEPEIDRAFASPTDQLAAALDKAAPVVYIRVDDDLTWRKL
jgi:hypothetical protein